jgi:hypothetical protein
MEQVAILNDGWPLKSGAACRIQAAFFLGTLAPFRRASDKPIAIACLRLLTRLPLLPLVNVPFFRLCNVRFTDFWALLP